MCDTNLGFCDPQAQKQMVNFDEGRMASKMGLPRVMVWLRVLYKSKVGRVKLGHGKPQLRYKLIKDVGTLRRIIELWKDVPVEHIQVGRQCQ